MFTLKYIRIGHSIRIIKIGKNKSTSGKNVIGHENGNRADFISHDAQSEKNGDVHWKLRFYQTD